jgi:hypothetical protein
MPSEDIKNLFSRFGNRSGRYHEIVREDQRSDSVGRWPLLSAVQVGEVRNIPGVTVKEAPGVAEARQDAVARQAPRVAQAGILGHLAGGLAASGAASMGSPKLVSATDLQQVDGSRVVGNKVLFGRTAGLTSSSAGTFVVTPPVPRMGFSMGSGLRAAALQPAANEVVQAQQRPAPDAVAGGSLVSIGDRSLKGVFGRLGGVAQVAADETDGQRAVPIFRRLRRP